MRDLKAKVRHVYDLHQLLQDQGLTDFFNSIAFEEMLLKVAHDDVASFKNNKYWLAYHPIKALMFRGLESVWNDLRPVYNGEFRRLVFSDFPTDTAVLMTLQKIKQRLTSIKWTIQIG